MNQVLLLLLVVLLVAVFAAAVALTITAPNRIIVPFSLTTTSTLAREEVREWALGQRAVDLGYARYRIATQTKKKVVFTRRSRTAAIWVLTIVLFPIGLLFYFLASRVSTVNVILSRTNSGGTDILVLG